MGAKKQGDILPVRGVLGPSLGNPPNSPKSEAHVPGTRLQVGASHSTKPRRSFHPTIPLRRRAEPGATPRPGVSADEANKTLRRPVPHKEAGDEPCSR